MVMNFERLLAQGKLPAAELVTLQQMIMEEAEEPLLLFAFRGERAGNDWMLEGIQKGTIDHAELKASDFLGHWDSSGERFVRPSGLELKQMSASIKHQRAAMLRFMNQAVEIAKLEPEEQGARLLQLQDGSPRAESALSLRFLRPGLHKLWKSFTSARAEMRCAAVALAVERYYQENGSGPESLDELVPVYIKQIPKDPFTGSALRFRRFDQGVVIYSVGDDRIDHGGQIQRRGTNMNGTDRGFRLWDMQHRRQPSQPFKLPEKPWAMRENWEQTEEFAK